MKKLVLLILFLTVSCRVISQTDTVAVRLNSSISKAVIKDLIASDACKAELAETNHLLNLTERQVSLLNGVVQNLERQKIDLVKIADVKSDQMEIQASIIKNTEKQLRKQEAATWFYKVGTLVGIITTGYLLIR